jgi:hypothetical protein
MGSPMEVYNTKTPRNTTKHQNQRWCPVNVKGQLREHTHSWFRRVRLGQNFRVIKVISDPSLEHAPKSIRNTL